jgi:hypothetical protein
LVANPGWNSIIGEEEIEIEKLGKECVVPGFAPRFAVLS